MGIPNNDTQRGGFVLLFLLLAIVPIALLGLGPDAGVAHGQEGDARVTGAGSAVFSSAQSEGVPACGFAVDASKNQQGPSGSFSCNLSAQAISLGIPFSALHTAVTDLEVPSQAEATLGGPAVVDLPDGGSMTDVPSSIHLMAGGPGNGRIHIVLIGVFDGKPGDEIHGDGNYTLVPQVVTDGSIDIQLEGPSPSPSPTGSPSPSPTGSPSPSPTTSPSPSPSPRPSPTPTPPGPPPPPIPGLGPPPPAPPSPDPPFVIGGPHSTARLMAILAQLSSGGTPPLDDILSVVGPFPVAGLAWWQNDWHAPRCCPYPHIHQGLDLFAPRGTPVVAAADGVISQKVNGPISGLGVEVTDTSGSTQYFYAHLSAFGPGISRGTHVNVGQVVGYVGNTGNASHTSPHLHFEVQPNGIPVPPMPVVDSWLVQSEQRAIALVEQRTGRTFSLPDEATIRLWIRKALELAGNGSDELGGEAAAAAPAAHVPASALLGVDASGPLIAFTTAAFLLLILLPAVIWRRLDAHTRKQPVGAGATEADVAEPAPQEAQTIVEPPEEQTDPSGMGRHRPAAR